MWPFREPEKPQEIYRVGFGGFDEIPVDDGREAFDIEFNKLCGECSDALKRLRLHHGCADALKLEMDKHKRR